MQVKIDRRLWILAMAAAIIVLQLKVPTEATSIWPPGLFVLAAIALYRKEIAEYDWKSMTKVPFWETVFFAVTQGMIAQAVGIVIIQYGIGIQPPTIDIVPTPAVILSAVVFSSILEELVYRKTIFTLLQPSIGFWGAASVSSILFAVAHYNYSAYLGYFLLGIVWCRAYRKTGNLAVVIAAHMIFNLIALTVMPLRG